MTSLHRNQRLAFVRIVGVIAFLAISTAVSNLHQIITKEQFISLSSITCSVFPVIFGFSITIMTIAGSMDSISTTLSWERLQIYQSTFESKLIRQCILGMSCFVTIIFAMLVQVVPYGEDIFSWVSRIFLWFGSFSLLISLTIPFSLYSLYSEKYEHILDEKRSQQNSSIIS